MWRADAGDVAPYDLGHAVLCLLQLRALRVAMVQTPRAAPRVTTCESFPLQISGFCWDTDGF